MKLRNIVLATALLSAPLVATPVSVSAQERGLTRAADATAQAESVAGWKNSAPKEPKELPQGVAQVFGDGQLLSNGQALPPGMSRTRDVAGGNDETSGGDEGDGGDTCDWVLVWVDGVWMLEDCNGNQVPVG